MYSVVCCALLSLRLMRAAHIEKEAYMTAIWTCVQEKVRSFENKPQLIEHFGYPTETVTAETEDGWSLDIHRIPYGIRSKSNDPNRPVIIMLHGLDLSSEIFLLNLPNQSAPFLFADQGYDVFIANTRGAKRYTRKTGYTVHDHEYWDFTVDDMAKYDLPAIFDAVEKKTSQTSFYYFGYSQANVIMFIRLSIDPLFNTRIRNFFAAGAATRVTHWQGVFPVICNTLSKLSAYWYAFKNKELGLGFLNNDLITELVKHDCTKDTAAGAYCASILSVLVGPSTSMNMTRLPVYLSHLTSGASVGNLQWYCQTQLTGQFKPFTFRTREENLKAYNEVIPKDYNLSNVAVPTYFFSSPQDMVTTNKDLEEFTLPQLKPSVVRANFILNEFNHLDYMLSLQATELIYERIINIVDADNI